MQHQDIIGSRPIPLETTRQRRSERIWRIAAEVFGWGAVTLALAAPLAWHILARVA